MFASVTKTWIDKSFLSRLPDQCSSFHLKVFAKPLSPSLLPVTTVPVKKSRKPTLTRARPSTDTLTQLPQPVRPPSRPPSESAMSNSLSRDRSLSRSTSALQTTASDLRRSRSTSNDMHRKPSERYTQERAVVRAPSGKDLFKDRQMTFVRRTSSMAKIRESQSLGLGRSQSQAKIGLLGRKTSDPKTRRNSEGQLRPNRSLWQRVKVNPVLWSLLHLPSLGMDVPPNLLLQLQYERSHQVPSVRPL